MRVNLRPGGEKDLCRDFGNESFTLDSGGNEKKVAFTKGRSSFSNPSAHNGDDRKTPSRFFLHRLAGCESVLFQQKLIAAREDRTLCFVHGGLDIREIDATQRLLDVKLTRLAVDARSIPVVNTVGRIGILLNLIDQETRPDRMEATAGNKNMLVCLHGNRVNTAIRSA